MPGSISGRALQVQEPESLLAGTYWTQVKSSTTDERLISQAEDPHNVMRKGTRQNSSAGPWFMGAYNWSARRTTLVMPQIVVIWAVYDAIQDEP